MADSLYQWHLLPALQSRGVHQPASWKKWGITKIMYIFMKVGEGEINSVLHMHGL